MRYFKVRSGLHVDEDKQEYGPGDVVSTELDLCAMFPNKFDELKGEEADKFAADNKSDKKPVEKLERVRAQRRGAMVPNEGTTEDKSDHPVDTKELTESGTAAGERVEGDEEDVAGGSSHGEDVTEMFSQAEDAGVKVFRDDEGTFRVVSAEDSEQVLEECSTKKEAAAAVKRQVK